MENFKLENFRKEYGVEMPIIRVMSFDECNVIQQAILQKFNIDKLDDFFAKEEKNFIKVDNVSAEDEDFNWYKVFDYLDIPIPHEVYINFDKFDKIDVISFENFNKYFSDIWYPAADDIEMFDMTKSWIISVRHYGSLYYTKM